MYFKYLETDRAAKRQHDDLLKKAAAERRSRKMTKKSK